VWANTSSADSSQTAYNYLPAMSTFLQTIVNGFTGLRLHATRLDLDPALPAGVNSVQLVGLDYLGAQLNVRVTSDEVVIAVQQGSPNADLRVCLFDPEEVHLLQPRREVRFRRRRASILSTTQPLPT